MSMSVSASSVSTTPKEVLDFWFVSWGDDAAMSAPDYFKSRAGLW